MSRSITAPAANETTGAVETARCGALIAFLALGLIWGSNFIFMKWASRTLTPEQITLARVFCGFLPVLGWALFQRSLSWRHLRHLHHFAVMALLATSVYYLAYAAGTSLLDSGIAGALSGAIPLFSFLAAALFLRSERIGPGQLVGVLGGFAGVLVIARPWDTSGTVDPLGVLYMLVGSASVGISFVYAKRFLAPLHLIWNDLLSRGRVRRPSRSLGAGASCFIVVGLVSVSLATRGQTDMRGLVTAGRCFRQERNRVSSIERRGQDARCS